MNDWVNSCDYLLGMSINPEIRLWRLNGQMRSLKGEICLRCGEKQFPPRDLGLCGHFIGPANVDAALARTRALARKDAGEAEGGDAFWLYVLARAKLGQKAKNFIEWQQTGEND